MSASRRRVARPYSEQRTADELRELAAFDVWPGLKPKPAPADHGGEQLATPLLLSTSLLTTPPKGGVVLVLGRVERRSRVAPGSEPSPTPPIRGNGLLAAAAPGTLR